MFSKQGSKTDEGLMKGIQNGSKSDFEILYIRYAKRLLAYFFNMLNKDEDQAQDFLQELFIKVIERSDQFDETKNFAAWIFTMASNMCKNEYRKVTIRRAFSDNHIKTTHYVMDESEHDMEEFRKSLSRALDHLDQEKKELYILRFEEELSIEQIAVVQDISEGTVKSRLFYLRKALAKQLKVFDPKMN